MIHYSNKMLCWQCDSVALLPIMYNAFGSMPRLKNTKGNNENIFGEHGVRLSLASIFVSFIRICGPRKKSIYLFQENLYVKVFFTLTSILAKFLIPKIVLTLVIQFKIMSVPLNWVSNITAYFWKQPSFLANTCHGSQT